MEVLPRTEKKANGVGENIQFCRQSRASLYESIDHLTICLDDNYINKDDFEQYRSECVRGIQLVNGYIRYLKKQKVKPTHREPDKE